MSAIIPGLPDVMYYLEDVPGRNVKVYDGTKMKQNGIDYVPYDTPLVNAVDMLLELSKKNGSKTSVTTEKDWQTLEFIVKLWGELYPEWSAEFYEHMKTVRATNKNSLGTAEEGTALIQHQLEVPQKLMQLIQVVFPWQEWNKDFVYKFVKRFKGFAGADKI